MLEKYGRHDWIRTNDLFRVNLARLCFSTTYNTAGTAKVRGSRARQQQLWVGLWVGIMHTHSHCFICSGSLESDALLAHGKKQLLGPLITGLRLEP